MDPEQRQRIIGYFLEESQEYLELLEPGVQDLSSALADPERINELYRAAHSIKGGAAMLELHGIQKVSYRLESSLKYMKGNEGVTPNDAIQATLLQGVEGLKQLTAEVRETLDLSEASSERVWGTIEPAFDELDAVLEQQVATTESSGSDSADSLSELNSGANITEASAEPAADLPVINTMPEVTDANGDLDELSWDDLDELNDLADLNAASDSSLLLSNKSNETEESPIEGLDELANLFEENPLDSDDGWTLDSSESVASPSASPQVPQVEEAAQTLDDLFSDELLGDSSESLVDATDSLPGNEAGAQAAAPVTDDGLDASFDDLFDAVDQSLEESDQTADPLGSLGLDTSLALGDTAETTDSPASAVAEAALPSAVSEGSTEDLSLALDAIDDDLELDLVSSSAELEASTPETNPLDAIDLDDLGGEDLAAPNGVETDEDFDFLSLDAELTDAAGDDAASLGSELGTSAEGTMTDAGTVEPEIDAFSTSAAEAALDSLESELGYSGAEADSSTPEVPSNDLDDLGLESLDADLAALDAGNGEQLSGSSSSAPDLESNDDNAELEALLADTAEADDADLLADLDEGLSLDDDLEDGSAGSAPAAPEATGLDDDLDALLDEAGSDSSSESVSDDSSFNDLDALLDDIAAESSDGEAFGDGLDTDDLGDEFNDLDSLLGDEPSPGVATAPGSSTPPSSDSGNSPQGDADFSDMEELLQQAQSIGGQQQVAPPPAAAAAASTSGRSRSQRLVEQSMRVPVKTLDNLSNLVGEMVVTRNSLEGDQERLRMALDKLGGHTQQLSDVGQQLQDLYERSLLENALLNSRRKVMGEETASAPGIEAATSTHTGSSEEGLDDLELDRFTGFHTLSQDIIELIVRIKESTDDIDFLINESLDQVSRNFRQTTSQLQEDVNRSRMVPFSQTADRLPRAVREISRKCGKEASLTVDGRETLIDKMLVEQLHDPLTHLINNAVTHGIETQDERILAGKSPTGNIRLQAFYQGNQTVISIADDGAGIDPNVVKRKAIEKGLIRQEEAENLGVSQIYDFLFHAGFSTRDQADAFAGRGVGMDVVRTRLQELRGTIVIDSEIGKGTTFTIRLPLTLSITKALHCISNRARIAFPFDGVEDMFDIPREQLVKNDEDQDCIQWRDMMLPVRELSDLLRYNRTIGRSSVYAGTSDDDMLALVILRSAGEYLAINVDRVEGEMDIVIKQLEGPVPKPTGIAGATVLADGQVMPIADVLELIDLSKGRTRQGANALWEAEGQDINEPTETPASDPLVLIVDDSITVRELLSMSFAKYGYRVEQARDGQEAWEKLRSGLPCNLIFCDIEMPRMTGLELLERMQKDEYLSTLPIAMLTSRGADRHRNLAAKFGARGYFTKPYLEESLLEAASRLLKGEVLINASGESE